MTLLSTHFSFQYDTRRMDLENQNGDIIWFFFFYIYFSFSLLGYTTNNRVYKLKGFSFCPSEIRSYSKMDDFRILSSPLMLLLGQRRSHIVGSKCISSNKEWSKVMLNIRLFELISSYVLSINCLHKCVIAEFLQNNLTWIPLHQNKIISN